MKRVLLSLFLLPLLSLACEGPSDELEGTSGADAAVQVETQMIKTHMGLEPKKAPWLLPLKSPRTEIGQARWEEIRSGALPPVAIWEREALGMEVTNKICVPAEWCDLDSCNGVDEDGINGDQIDETEYPILPAANYLTGWHNCGAFSANPPFRCDHWGSGGNWYLPTGCWQPTCATASLTGPGDQFYFTDSDMHGYCAGGTNTSPSQTSNLGNVYPNNVFKDTISSFRWGGGCTSGGQKMELWDFSGFSGWPWNGKWTSPNGPTQMLNLNIVGANDYAAALKTCVP